MPMHQEPAISDEEVERRLGAGRRARPAVARRHREVLPRRRARVGHRVAASTPARSGVNAHPFWPDVERYAELVRRFTAAGFSAITHAVGDGAVHGALDAYEAAGPPRRGMHRVEHIETLDRRGPAALRRARRRRVDAAAAHGGPRRPGRRRARGSTGSRRARYERGFRPATSRASGRDPAARLGLDGRRLRPARRDGMGAAAARARAARSASRICRARRSTASRRCAATRPARPQSPATRTVYGRLRPGLRADITALGADPVETDPDELPTCRSSSRWSTGGSCDLGARAGRGDRRRGRCRRPR